MSSARLFLAALALAACHKSEPVADADASPVDASVASPCAWPAVRTADALGQPELQTLVRKCTGQTPEATSMVNIARLSNGSVLAYVETLDGDGGVHMLMAFIDSPPMLAAWTIGDKSPPNYSGLPSPALTARFDTLRGETVIVEGLSSNTLGMPGSGLVTPMAWERVWLRRGHDLVDAGRYALSGETPGKADDPVRAFEGKALFHGDRIELRENVTWSWYRTSYSDVDGYQRTLLARTTTTYEHGFTLKGDKLEADVVPETTPSKPKTKP